MDIRTTGVLKALAVLVLLLPSQAVSARPATPAPSTAPAMPEKPEEIARCLLDMAAPARDWEKVVPYWTDDNPPPDDAPLDVLLLFWEHQGHWCRYGDAPVPRPTPKVRARLLEAVLEKPERFSWSKRFLPDSPEDFAKLKALHDKLARAAPATEPADPNNPDWPPQHQIHHWLLTRSLYFRDELVAAAKEMIPLPRATRYTILFDPESWGPDDFPLPVLARLDWKAAEPILWDHANDANDANRGAAAAALGLLYRHAVQVGDRAQADKYRQRLQKLAEGSAATDDVRPHVMTVLMGSSWPGREEWFASLFARENWFGNDFAVAMYQDPNALIPVAAKLVSSKDITARYNAVECLLPADHGDRTGVFGSRPGPIDPPPAQALVPLLPWLTDPNWAIDDKHRERLIKALSKVDLPESIPGLLWVLRNETDENGLLAAHALGRQKAKQAGPELMRLFDAGRLPLWTSSGGIFDSFTRDDVFEVRDLLACSAISDQRFAETVEAYIRRILADPNSHPVRTYGGLFPPLPAAIGEWRLDPRSSIRGFFEEPAPLTPPQQAQKRADAFGAGLLGCLCDHDAPARLLLARARAVREKEPRIAQAMLVALVDSNSPEVDREIAGVLARGADMPTILCALSYPERTRKNVPRELGELARAGGPAAGVAAAVLADANACRDILRGSEAPAQAMLLACARLIRTPLGVDDVAALWTPRDKLLALACERYLESEDSPAARKVVWSHYPKRPPILGARINFAPKNTYFGGFDRIEKPFVRKMSKKSGPDEIIALVEMGQGGPCGQWVIEFKGGRRTLTFERKRYDKEKWSREMTDEEFRRLTTIIEQGDFENLPALTRQAVDGVVYEYLHLTRRSALRVYMDNPGLFRSPGTPYDLLARFFRGLGS